MTSAAVGTNGSTMWSEGTSTGRESTFTESVVEDAALAWLEGLGYTVLNGPEIAAGNRQPNEPTRTTATSYWKAGCGKHSRG